MSYQVSIPSKQISFQVESEQLILDAAMEQGINLPYGCKNGFCGACEGKILKGKVTYDKQPPKLTDKEIKNGRAFFCSCKAESDLEIEVEVIEDTTVIEAKLFPSRIEILKKYTDDVMLMALKLPDSERMQFLPGQYIDILLEDDKKRSFSIANPPHADDLLELHIRHIDGGLFTDKLFSSIKEKDILRIEGPHGSFYYREKNNRPLIFMAGGTGFAPIKSIIEHLIAEKTTQKIYLYWGARTQNDLYMKDLAQQWANNYDHIQFHPVLSQAEEDSLWQGKKGYVHQAICDDFEDLSDYDIYACGPPPMIDSGKIAFKNAGHNEKHFYFDSFDYAAQPD